MSEVGNEVVRVADGVAVDVAPSVSLDRASEWSVRLCEPV